MSAWKCERCGSTPEGEYGLLDYCAVCSKNLCDKCMAKGHCGNVPAKSGMNDDYGDEQGIQVKKTDTSLKAFAGIRRITGFREKKIFEELKKHEDVGLTGTEIELRLSMRDASSRIHRLVKDGWIVRTPEKRRNPPREHGRQGALAYILIVPKSVRDGGVPTPTRVVRNREKAVPSPVKPIVKFTVQTDAHPLGVAWLMLGKFCVAKYSDSENGNGNVSANAVAFHLNRVFELTEKVR